MGVFDEKLQDVNWWREKCKTDLYFLTRCVLQILEDPTPGYKDLYRPTHKRICNFVQRYAREGQKVLILTPRGWIKSYLITIGWVIQRLLCNTTSGNREHGIIDNATIGNAKEFLAKIKYNIQFNELLRGIFADVLPVDCENGSERWTQDEFQILGNRFETGSVEGNLVSRHYKIMVHDDLVNRDNSQTGDQLAKTIDWWRLAQSLLLPTGIELIIGTRWNYDDLYGEIIEKFIKPPRDYLGKSTYIELHNGCYHMLHIDCWQDVEKETGSTFPHMFPEWKLKQLESEQADRFYGQYRNDPLATGRNPFNRTWIRHFKMEQIPATRVTRILIDPSGKADVKSDHTGIVVMHFGADKKGYIELGKRFMITDRALADWIIFEAPKYLPDTIEVEDNKFKTIMDFFEVLIPQYIRQGKIDTKYIEFVKRIPNIMIELKPHQRNKDYRIRHLTSWIESGTFMLAHNNTEDLYDELIRYTPKSQRDDIVDALSYCLDGIIFPKKTDPPKFLDLPEELKLTASEREKIEWEEVMKQQHNPAAVYGDSEDWEELEW